MPPEVVHYTTAEVAARYGVDSSTVRRWVARGVIKPSIKTPGGHYRFAQADLPAGIAAPAEAVA